jgi:hypothetical protein
MYFIHEHWNYLPATVVSPEFFMYCEFLGFVGRIYVPSLYRPIFLGSCYTSTVVSSTLGFRVVLAKAWSFLPQLKGSMAFEPCFKYLAGIIGALDFSDPVHFAEMVDGAGGTLDDLACLTKRYLDDLAGKTFESGWPGMYIRSLMRFILIPEPEKGDQDPQCSFPPSEQETFFDALRHCGS